MFIDGSFKVLSHRCGIDNKDISSFSRLHIA